MKDAQNISVLILMVVYLGLLSGTGYIAFFDKGIDPASETYKVSTDVEVYKNAQTIDDPGARQSFLQALSMISESTKKKVEFAFQSFNIVLGATLGFLSALATRFIGTNMYARRRDRAEISQPEPDISNT